MGRGLTLGLFVAACGGEPTSTVSTSESLPANRAAATSAVPDMQPRVDFASPADTERLGLVANDCETVSRHVAGIVAADVRGVRVTTDDVAAAFSQLCKGHSWTAGMRACKRAATTISEIASCDRPQPTAIEPRWNGRNEDCATVVEHVERTLAWAHSGDAKLAAAIAANQKRDNMAKRCSGWPAGVRVCLLSTTSLDVMSVCFLGQEST